MQENKAFSEKTVQKEVIDCMNSLADLSSLKCLK